MILVDLNQVMISNLMMNLQGNQGAVDESLVRHMVFNSLRMYKQKFSNKYGDLVVCCDDKHYWRKDIFPYYKASRKTDRAKSPYDWNEIFTALNNIRDEIKENAPYKVIQVDPTEYLLEHAIKGDRGDGIPNILSEPDVFVNGGRQKPVTKKKMSDMKNLYHTSNGQMWNDRFDINMQLVNLSLVPDNIKTSVLEQLNSTIEGSRRKLLDLFISKRMNIMIESIEEF